MGKDFALSPMKTSSLLSVPAFFLFASLPVSLLAEELYENEFELVGLPKAEEESSWELSVGIEGVFGKGQTDGSSQISIKSGYQEKYQWTDTSHIEKYKAKPQSFGGINFRVNWTACNPIEETKIFPEFYILFGFLSGDYDCEALSYNSIASDIEITLLQISLGGNLHYPLSKHISIFGGLRLGGSSILMKDDFSSLGGVYGIGAGIDCNIGNGGGAIRIGVDYLATMLDGEVGENLSLSNPKWLLFSLGYNTRF